jgi:methylenetetrahydrofolate dehydrogenase (NAD+)
MMLRSLSAIGRYRFLTRFGRSVHAGGNETTSASPCNATCSTPSTTVTTAPLHAKVHIRRHKSAAAFQEDSGPSEDMPQEHLYEQNYDPFLDEPMELVKEVADSIRQYVRNYTQNHEVKLLAITASRSFTNDIIHVDQGADTYSEWIGRTCQEDGIDYQTWRVAGGTDFTAQQIQNMIERANKVKDIHGVLVYYPLYSKPYILGAKHGRWSVRHQHKQINRGCEDYLLKNKLLWPALRYKTRDDLFRDSVDPSRDVEGLCPVYHSRKLFRDQKTYVDRYDGVSSLDSTDATNASIFPCTALAVVRILKKGLVDFDSTKPVGRRFEGVTVTIINRSQILGRPLASLLTNDGATVYSVDADSVVLIKPGGTMDRCFRVDTSVKACVEKSSVLVTGVPSSTYRIPTQWIQPNSTVINVSSEANVDEDGLREVPGVQYISAVGKVTVALLEHNLVQLHRRFHS